MCYKRALVEIRAHRHFGKIYFIRDSYLIINNVGAYIFLYLPFPVFIAAGILYADQDIQ